MSRRILVTGASGFVGSVLAKRLAEDFDVVTAGRTEQGSASEHFYWDINEGPLSLSGNFEGVIHCAGLAHQPQADADQYFRVNVEGTRALLRALDTLKEPLPPLVHISTVAVYGRSCGLDIDEERTLGATDPYGQSKAEAEKLVREWGLSRKVSVLILRLPLVVGRGAPGNLGKMVSAIVRSRFVLVGGGTAVRSMVLLPSLAEQIPELIGRAGVYNLNDGRGASYKELGYLVADGYGLPRPWRIPKAVSWLAACGLEAMARVLGRQVVFDMETYRKLTRSLTFSCEKAVREIGWRTEAVMERPEMWLE